MVKPSSSQKPRPHDSIRSDGAVPIASPATNTITVAASANTNASGSQRSANPVNAIARRESTASVGRFGAGGAEQEEAERGEAAEADHVAPDAELVEVAVADVEDRRQLAAEADQERDGDADRKS